MPIEVTPIDSPVDTTPAETTSSDVVGDYMDLMADQDWRKSWREGSNSAEHFTPSEVAEMYRLKREQELDASRASNGIFRRIVD